MNTTEDLQDDRRIILLVVIGLCVCLPHLDNALWCMPECRGDKPRIQSRMAWIETDAAPGSGLYWLDVTSRTWQSIAALELHPPSELWSTGGGISLPAYRFQAEGQPQAIPFPAQVAPVFFQRIPINQASLETLVIIPGIGRRLAASIIDYRDRAGGINDRDSLLEIEGIGEKKAATIAGYVRFE